MTKIYLDAAILDGLADVTRSTMNGTVSALDSSRSSAEGAPRSGWDWYLWQDARANLEAESSQLDADTRALRTRANETRQIAGESLSVGFVNPTGHPGSKPSETPLAGGPSEGLEVVGGLGMWAAKAGFKKYVLVPGVIAGVAGGWYLLGGIARSAALPGELVVSGGFLEPIGVAATTVRNVTGVTLLHGHRGTFMGQLAKGPLGVAAGIGVSLAWFGVDNYLRYRHESYGKVIGGFLVDTAIYGGVALALVGLVGTPVGWALMAGGLAAFAFQALGGKDWILDNAPKAWNFLKTEAKVVGNWSAGVATSAGTTIGNAARAFDAGVKKATEPLFAPFKKVSEWFAPRPPGVAYV